MRVIDHICTVSLQQDRKEATSALWQTKEFGIEHKALTFKVPGCHFGVEDVQVRCFRVGVGLRMIGRYFVSQMVGILVEDYMHIMSVKICEQAPTKCVCSATWRSLHCQHWDRASIKIAEPAQVLARSTDNENVAVWHFAFLMMYMALRSLVTHVPDVAEDANQILTIGTALGIDHQIDPISFGFIQSTCKCMNQFKTLAIGRGVLARESGVLARGRALCK